MKDIDEKVIARLRAPFTCEFVSSRSLGPTDALGRWRVADANDDAIASCAAAEEGYARLIVQCLNEHFEKKLMHKLRVSSSYGLEEKRQSKFPPVRLVAQQALDTLGDGRTAMVGIGELTELLQKTLGMGWAASRQASCENVDPGVTYVQAVIDSIGKRH